MAVKETRYDSVESLLRSENGWDYSYDIFVSINGGVETIRAAKTVTVDTARIQRERERKFRSQIRRELSGRYYDEDGNPIK